MHPVQITSEQAWQLVEMLFRAKHPQRKSAYGAGAWIKRELAPLGFTPCRDTASDWRNGRHQMPVLLRDWLWRTCKDEGLLPAGAHTWDEAGLS